jgi:hypothetical protein
MKMPRGLFGAKAREAVAQEPNTNPERSYLGGLVKYQRPQGQSGADRMALFGSALSDVGAALDGRQGGGVAAMQQNMLAQQAANQQAEQLKGFEASITDPRELAFFRAAPEPYLKAMAERFKPMTVAGGSTVLNGPSGTFTAPNLVNDDGIYGTQTADGYTQTGQRGPSIAETETGRHNKASETMDAVRAAIARGQLTVQQGQLILDREKHTARSAAGGYGTPGSGGGWEEF